MQLYRQRPNSENQKATGQRTGHYTDSQLFFLLRLERALRKRNEYKEYAGEFQDKDPTAKLLNRGIYSTYCDCIDLGVGNEAREFMRKYE